MMDNALNEQKMLRLFEERGVAASPWKREIDRISNYIRNFVRTTVSSDTGVGEFDFYVPIDISNVFPFLDDFDIHVFAKPGYDGSQFGYGSFSSKNKLKFSVHLKQFLSDDIVYSDKTKKLHNGLITLVCYYDKNGKLAMNTVLDTFYHEIDHAYDEWKDASIKGNFNRFNKSALKAKTGKTISTKFPYIGECIYRLFSETEYNALVASVYGDLAGMDSEYYNFRDDYKKTQAYFIYSELTDHLENEIDSLSDDDCELIFGNMEAVGIRLNMHNDSVASFKRAFVHKAQLKLTDLIHDIGKAASYYYDKKYEISIYNRGHPYSIS